MSKARVSVMRRREEWQRKKKMNEQHFVIVCKSHNSTHMNLSTKGVLYTCAIILVLLLLRSISSLHPRKFLDTTAFVMKCLVFHAVDIKALWQRWPHTTRIECVTIE